MSDVDDVGLARLDAIARDALRSYGIGPEAELALLNISENATYRVDDPVGGTRTVLRVNRPGYHSRPAIESELAWIRALRDDDVVRTPHVVHSRDDQRVVTGTHPDGEQRNAVMFEWVPGTEPPEDRLVEDFEELGTITARLHLHTRTWRRPDWFTRFRWDYERSVGADGHWGRWEDGMGVGPAEHEQLGRLSARLRQRLAAFGTGPDRFGLIHADMRLANLLVDDGPGHERSVSVIDFDDCGFGWYMYDLGSSVSFIEHDPRVPEMTDSWVRGYRSVAPLPDDDAAELPTFVLLRRLLLVAWIGSHSDTELAQGMGKEYTRVSCDLAEDYLSRF
ncbi:MAG: phosphotransferase enzyme family protein [Kineosporiaceae bacterium]